MAFQTTVKLILCLFLIASVSIETQGHGTFDLFGQDKMMLVDPFLSERCKAKNLTTEMSTCIQQKTTEYLSSSETSPTDFTGILCGMQEPMKPCMDAYIDEVKKCYDKESDKTEVGKAADVVTVSFDYMCEDDAKEIRDLMSDEKGKECIDKMMHLQKTKEQQCTSKYMADIQKDEMQMHNNKTCLAAFNTGRCVIEHLKECDMKVYNWFLGLSDAVVAASPCKPYVEHLLGAAGAPGFSIWMLLLIFLGHVFFNV